MRAPGYGGAVTAASLARIIGVILAPVVMITSCSIFMNGLFTRYESVSARMRSLHRERLDLIDQTRPGGAGAATSHQRRRIDEIERQLPGLLRRHRLIRNAVMAVSTSLLILVGSMFLIAAAETTGWVVVAGLALLAFLLGTAAFLAGVAIAAFELWHSQREVEYEILDGLAIR
jgi:hypothetical protein